MASSKVTRRPRISTAPRTIRSGWGETEVRGQKSETRNQKLTINDRKLVASLGGVAAEEGIRLPLRAGIGIGDRHQKLANDFLIQAGRSEIDGLGKVVGRCVIAVGEPVLENFLFRRAGIKSDIQLERGNSVANEIVLITANEDVAQRLRVSLNANAKELRGFAGAIAKIGFRESRNFEDFQRDDGQKHVDVDVRDHRLRRHGRMSGEIF